MAVARFFITVAVLVGVTHSQWRLEASDFGEEVQRIQNSSAAITPEEDAPGAVDGQITNYYSFHTGQENPPWWQVDLGQKKSLAVVRIYSPHYSERLTKFRLLVSDDAQAWKTVHTHAATTNEMKRFDITLQDVEARHVRIAASAQTWMHLDEVMIFAPGDRKTNLALRRPCTQSSVSTWSSRSAESHPKGDWRFAFDAAREVIAPVLKRMGTPNDLTTCRDQLIADRVSLDDARWDVLYRDALVRSAEQIDLWQQFELIDLDALARSLDNLATRHPDRYPDVGKLRGRLTEYRKSFNATDDARQAASWDEAVELVQFHRDVLLRNPLLDFEKMVLLRRRLGENARSAMGASLGVGTLNSHTNDSLRRTGWDNSIVQLTDLGNKPVVKELYDAEGRLITDLEVDFDTSRMMFSSIGSRQTNWRIFEMSLEGESSPRDDVRQVTPDDGDDVGHFDSCYLADSNEIIFGSTASYQGLPCEYGSKRMTCLYKLNRSSGNVRQLTFEQDSDWSPTPMHDGRVMYLRWEYSDLPHSSSRILFQMRPDGSAQREYYGSGSYFMPSYFYARVIPGHDTKVVGVATGHHGTPRSGRLIIVDPKLGRREAQGVVQEIPGWGKKVQPEVRDRLADFGWPHFLHPYALSDEYFITAMKPKPGALWGVYLVDVFDNLTLLYQEEGTALLDPIPLIARPAPPVIADQTVPGEKNATVFLSDVYAGEGLKDVPSGVVKRIRVGTYYFSSHGTGGLLGSVGADGPWDIKRVLGTVPVEDDGSASFTIPANTPVFLQPLDEEGKALQLMRSWMVGMPGETVSCVGCHEDQNSTVLAKQTKASLRLPTPIEPDRKVVRGFSFPHEIQPVLDRYCVGCHDGAVPTRLPRIDGITYPADLSRDQDNGEGLVDLRGVETIKDWKSGHGGNSGGGSRGGNFPVSYVALERYVRRNGIEGPLHMLSPGEFHADTTELVQMLRDGRHYNVRLDAASWQRLITWIDLNAPCHGTWAAIGEQPAERVAQVNDRRIELARTYANIDTDFEQQEPLPKPGRFQPPEATSAKDRSIATIADWPFSAEEALAKVKDVSPRMIDLGDGVKLQLVRVPAGEYVNAAGQQTVVDRSFWMAQFETTNEQMRCFEPTFDARREDRYGYQFGRLCYGMNGDEMAAVRVDWNKADAFCRWLSARTGQTFSLPTDSQWQWACRAGSDGDFWFGSLDDDFTPYANLGDVRLIEFASNTNTGGYTTTSLIGNPGKYDDRIPRDRQFDDGVFLTNRYARNEKGVMLATPTYQTDRPEGWEGMPQVAEFKPNPWGLYDMHGNVWEWTSTETRSGRKVACGGSFYDRPKRCTAGSRVDYKAYHKVFNVGFRVICYSPKVGLNHPPEKEVN
ncbi:MAG: SUMF1/EgtB/PvdO family nonheme iron enzyme [Fuerstiella sp.]|nr:SUMF1/EgtB/PvdO family nonheme iron enzyme [Fuerstiella sp.]